MSALLGVLPNACSSMHEAKWWIPSTTCALCFGAGGLALGFQRGECELPSARRASLVGTLESDAMNDF